MVMSPVKISIITITYNSERTLKETLESVVSQNYPDLEYIIIDGGSKDATLSILESYKEHISYLVSEKDDGISDAFNKGIKVATGDVIGILNSDDLLLPNALHAIAEAYEQGVDVYRGNIILWNDVTQYKCREIPSMKFPKVPYVIHVAHPATFITREAYQKHGVFDLSFHYAMDLELLCRFYREGAVFKYVDADLAMFRIGGATSESLRKKKDELMLLIRKNGGTAFHAKLYYAFVYVFDLAKSFLNLFGEDFKRKLRYKS